MGRKPREMLGKNKGPLKLISREAGGSEIHGNSVDRKFDVERGVRG
jgi:hypothetical protein